MNAVVFALAFAAIAARRCVARSRVDRRGSLGCALLCALYLGLDDLVTGLPSVSGAFDVLGGGWNWSGKLYSLLLSIAVLLALGIRPAAAGLTWRQRNVGTSLVALGLFGAWGFTLGWVFQPGAADVETYLFQATMPGLSEELVYRGIAPAILLGLLRGRDDEPGMPWGVIVVTALVFGVWHGLGYWGGGFSFDWQSALFPFIGSLAGGWLRFHSGSLLFPVLAHGVANVAYYLGPMAA